MNVTAEDLDRASRSLADQADQIREHGKEFDYEQKALEALALHHEGSPSAGTEAIVFALLHAGRAMAAAATVTAHAAGVRLHLNGTAS